MMIRLKLCAPWKTTITSYRNNNKTKDSQRHKQLKSYRFHMIYLHMWQKANCVVQSQMHMHAIVMEIYGFLISFCFLGKFLRTISSREKQEENWQRRKTTKTNKFNCKTKQNARTRTFFKPFRRWWRCARFLVYIESGKNRKWNWIKMICFLCLCVRDASRWACTYGKVCSTISMVKFPVVFLSIVLLGAIVCHIR